MFTLAKLSLVNPENSVSFTRTTANQPQGDDLPNAIANQNRNNSSNISDEYVDDDSMTGNAKATSKLRNLIVGEELHLLGLGADFEKVMTIACKQPINASEFDSAFNAFKDKVENKRSELGLCGKSDNSPASQVNIMMAKLKNGTSPQETLADLLRLKSSANSRTPEGRQTIAIVTPYINGLQALNSKKTTFTDKDGKTVDKNEDSKNALLNQDVSKINSILNEINEAQNPQIVKSERASFMSFFQNTDFVSKNNIDNTNRKEQDEHRKKSIMDCQFLNHGWKFQSRDDFNKKFNEIWSKNQGNGDKIVEEFNNLNLQGKLNIDFIKTALNNPTGIVPNNPDLIFTNVKWSADPLRLMGFFENTFDETSPENLPDGYDMKKIFNNGKKSDLGIDKIHSELNIKGKGVSYAIIDTGAKLKNGETHSSLNFASYTGAQQYVDRTHGHATAYLAQKTAPDASCHYYETQDGDINQRINHLKSILDKNKTLPDGQKIRIVSCSFSLPIDPKTPKYTPEVQAIVDEAHKQGIWILDSQEFFKHFGYLEKKNPMSDSNDFNNYQISHPGGKTSQSNEKPKLFINSGNKTVADPNGKGVYRHDASSCASWAIPVLAGQYVLACEADPNMTPEKFIQLAHETATTIKSTTREHDENGGVDFSRRTDYEVDCKIINMEALIKRIQSNKN